MALLVATNEMLAAPIGTRRTIAHPWVGERATARMATPKIDADAGQQAGRRPAPEGRGQAAGDGARAHGRQEPAVETGTAVEGELGQERAG